MPDAFTICNCSVPSQLLQDINSPYQFQEIPHYPLYQYDGGC